MKIRKIMKILAVLSLLAVLGVSASGSGFKGTAKLGWVLMDIDGNQSVYQPTYNLYEGPSFSLERFNYRFDNGVQFFGNLRNLTLNNRNAVLNVMKPGMFGVSFTNNQYRRTYTFDGDRFTRRNQTMGDIWFQPIEYVKIFGGYGITNKEGDLVRLYDISDLTTLTNFDYKQQYYNAGVKLGYERSYLQAEYRGSTFSDELNELGDRNYNRFRVTAVTPVPRYKRNFILNGGFQHYTNRVENRDDTLSANTVWGGVRYYNRMGFFGRYSFIWDRAHRTTDLTSTDNITHSVYAGRNWLGIGGATLGYHWKTNDDASYELRTNSYFFSGWVQPITDVRVRAGFGTDNMEVQSGRTLTGDRDYTRFWGSVQYKYKYGTARFKAESRQVDNDDISTSTDYLRLATDVSATYDEYGTVTVAYAYLDGDYDNTNGSFDFKQHVLSWNLLSVERWKAQAGFSGTYYRTKCDLNVESFTLSFLGRYEFWPSYKIEVKYSAYNYDNLNDRFPVYTQYYTSNVVELNLIKDF